MSSQVGIPTDRRMKDPTYLKDKIEHLLETERTLSEAVAYYDKKIKVDDWWKPWYENAKESYAKKLETVSRELRSIGGKEAEIKAVEASTVASALALATKETKRDK